MSFSELSVEEMENKLEIAERELRAKRSNHRDYPHAKAMVDSIRKEINKKRKV